MKDQGERLQSTSKHSSLHTRHIDHSRALDKCPLHGQVSSHWVSVAAAVQTSMLYPAKHLYRLIKRHLGHWYYHKAMVHRAMYLEPNVERITRLSSLIHLISMVKGLLSHLVARVHVTYVDSEILHVTKNRFLTSYEIVWRLVSPFFLRFDKKERLSWSFQVVLNTAKYQYRIEPSPSLQQCKAPIHFTAQQKGQK